MLASPFERVVIEIDTNRTIGGPCTHPLGTNCGCATEVLAQNSGKCSVHPLVGTVKKLDIRFWTLDGLFVEQVSIRFVATLRGRLSAGQFCSSSFSYNSLNFSVGKRRA